MTDGYHRFVRSTVVAHEEAELGQVDDLAATLVSHLDASAETIDAIHVHGAQSKSIQDVVGQLLAENLGFRHEKVLTQSEGFITRARADFIFPLTDGRGIIAEVERGGTTTNNHDLKDIWKAHIAPDIHHLFLVVPRANWNEAGTARERPFNRVVNRLGSLR